MTRENEINIAASKYIEDNSLGGEVCISSRKDSFIEGADWADNNPKSPWISVKDDLPFNHKELLDSSKRMTFQVFIRYGDGRYGFSCMAKILDEWKWLNNWTKITHWMKVPEIPKEE